ncbi:hypothetical protein OJAV_G00165670 [Oryzias javanicus]|uniref:Antifreeze protein type IV n=1 Tax=Oryzias javanicus TaxID=123683 RepID=A0A3S2PWV8_ORYJA|nr:hypothetical protein OJAV_G00165670 [Oryzias javanicus]
MKFSCVAALLVVLAVTRGCEAVSLVRRDAPSEVDRLTQLMENMSASIAAATQEVVDKMKALEMTSAAHVSKLQPLVEQVQAEAAKLQEQVKPYVSNIEEHIRPLTDNLNSHVKPLTDMMEKLLQQVVDQSKALLPPQ